MHQFKDSESTQWQLSVTLGSAKRVRELLGVDLLNPDQPVKDGAADRPLITCLDTDLLMLCDVLYALCKPQADEREVTDEQFGARLGGDAILAAHHALFAEMADFFRGAGRRDLVTLITKQMAIVEAGITAAENKINQLDTDQLVAEAMDLIPGGGGKLSTSSPASSGSDPPTSTA